MLDVIVQSLVANSVASIASSFLFLATIHVFHALFLSPYAHIPGSLLRRLTPLPLWITHYLGQDPDATDALHQRYGPIVLVGPQDVDIADGAAIASIYGGGASGKRGFDKAPCYANFNVDGHSTIFTALEAGGDRAIRAKSVAPLFATARLHSEAGSSVLRGCAEDFVEALRTARERSQGGEVDLLDLTRRLALDSLSGYIFGRRYGSFNAHSSDRKLSIGPFIDDFIESTRCFLLPAAIIQAIGILSTWLFRSGQVERATAEVDAFVRTLVHDADRKGAPDTFQKRLLGAGISREETSAQCKDLIFAGVDTTGATLAMLIWYLLKQPQTLRALRTELSASHTIAPVQTRTPILHAVIRETLRISTVVPVRLPRIVPAEGWTYTPTQLDERNPDHISSQLSRKSYSIPPGTSIGVSAQSVHFNSATYPSPFSFESNRWLSTDDGPAGTANMARGLFAFGAGSRACIGRNLAMEELVVATKAVINSGVLEGATAVGEEITRVKWLNARIGEVKIRWRE